MTSPTKPVIEQIQKALDAVSSPERWELDVSWDVAEADNECWATGPIHPVDGTANLAKADAAYIRATQPLHMRNVLALIQSQAAEIERMRSDGRTLRRMLGEQWCANQAIPFPYTDDGEFSDGSTHPCIDFMNDSAADIRKKMQTRILSAIPAKTGKTGRATTQPKG